MKSKIKWRELIICILIPQLVGGLSGFLSMGSRNNFETLVRPNFAPPGAVFGIVWPILYLTMGIALYLVITTYSSKKRELKRRGVMFYIIQLTVNFLWSIIFFRFEMRLFAFWWIILLIVLVIGNMYYFYKVRKSAGLILIPYFLWISFASVLNYSIYMLNK